MGVPALFRWLSKKYPKIVQRVVEDTPTKVLSDTGDVVEVPIKYESQNPNGFEVDNLYLDMNGIVHPCTHPEGKPAPETEEEMMVEIFNYTERVVNMTRPRKVLMMAIDGVAPRAKMNQQRSRRFRAAQEAADKEEEKKESIRLYEAMGHKVSDETRNHKAWDSNAITPGTPFMDLLSNSLKYWVSYKLSTDPGWKDLKIIISDSSVPGEGEHKIVDWIRRQRSYPDWNPNTSHVMYGLDADLIMLSLATHEPFFRVLREDVFAQGSKGPQPCRNCGEPGHYAANCKTEKPLKDPTLIEKAKPVDPKPFIFLDVSVLREYLAVELVVPGVPFPFDLELAIDDWIFMIFFVGNDFLPHLPSLEIREGAIDVLLKIWRSELGRMGGYLTNHGKVNLDRAGVILEGLAKSEDDIFQRRKEDEERQDQRAKRNRIEDHRRQDVAKALRDSGTSTPTSGPGSMTMNGTEYVAVTPASTARGGALHPSLPTRPGFDIVPKEEPVVKGKKMSASQREAAALNAGKNAMLEAQGSNKDVFENRKKIRMANLSAAQLLKAELEGGGDDEDDVKPVELEVEDEKEEMAPEDANAILAEQAEDEGVDEELVAPPVAKDEDMENGDAGAADGPNTESRGTKRKVEEREEKDEIEKEEEDEEDELEAPPDIEADQPVSKKKLKVNSDGTVDYEDEVRLWEPGYRERYYQAKFGVPVTDTDFIRQVTKCYMEGLCWVLEYYYQGVPAWDWYYPYHYAPFAQDFKDVGSMEISFEVAQPFKPFAQLLGVFPAASRIHLPEPLQTLMINEDSPILDFYPSDFEIDMNGKKMAWQGVALLPFIDQTRLLDALQSKEEELTDDEKRRNRWGDNIMFVGETNRLYDELCGLYSLKPATNPVPLDTKLSLGTNGSVLADPACVPNSTYDTPIPGVEECPDIENNQSLSVRYFFPRQRHPHQSKILNGYRPGVPVLTESDKDRTRSGSNGDRPRGGGPRHSHGPTQGSGPGISHAHHNQRGGYGGGPPRSSSYPDMRGLAQQGVHGGPPSGYYTPPAQASYGYGGPAPSAYSGAAAGGGYGGYGGGAAQGGYGYGAPSSAYAAPPPNPYGRPAAPPPAGGYGGYGGAYAPPPRNPYGAPPPNPYGAPPPRNPYAAAPPPNPYGRDNRNGGAGGGYGGYGGGYGQGSHKRF